MAMGNVKASTKTKEAKNRCMQENKVILDYAYYLFGGFFLKPQLLTILSVISGIEPKRAKAMIGELCDKGLLIQKQATSTKANFYVMTSFALASYNNCSSQNVSSIKLNNRKIWLNLYRGEYIIREILPNVIGKIHTCKGLLKWMEERFIDIFRVQNQEEIFKLYYQFYQKFPVLNKINFKSLPDGEFTRDYFACTAEYHDFILNFQNKTEIAKKFEGYEQYKNHKKLSRALYDKEEDRNKHCFNFSQMAGQGFFFTSLMRGKSVEIGLFDTYTNMQLSKIYQNGIYILCMFQRYLGFVPELKLTVYVRDEYTRDRLTREEERTAYNYLEREASGYNKRKDFFFRMGVLAWESNLKVEYKVYNLEKKYHL